MKFYASRIALTAALALGLSACGGSDEPDTDKPSSAPSASKSSAAPSDTPTTTDETKEPAVSGTGAVMPLRPSKAPSDWATEGINGRYKVSAPDGYVISVDGSAKARSGETLVQVITDLGGSGEKPSMQEIYDNAEASGEFPEGVEGYVAANELIDWPNTDGAVYTRQNVKSGNVTTFLLDTGGNERLALVVSYAEGSNYDQNVVDKILSTVTVK